VLDDIFDHRHGTFIPQYMDIAKRLDTLTLRTRNLEMTMHSGGTWTIRLQLSDASVADAQRHGQSQRQALAA
jgi:hypothetical protein